MGPGKGEPEGDGSRRDHPPRGGSDLRSQAVIGGRVVAGPPFVIVPGYPPLGMIGHLSGVGIPLFCWKAESGFGSYKPDDLR